LQEGKKDLYRAGYDKTALAKFFEEMRKIPDSYW
jgi:predicted Zn-dependent protease